MKSILQPLFVSLFNCLANLLKNRDWHKLSREEIRLFRSSFSQFGEDLAVTRWTDELKIEKGHYLDIGAFHPIHMSNTLLLYHRGWSGINIDMNPDKIAMFDRSRPHDDNLCCAISTGNNRYVIEHKGLPTERLRELRPDENAETLDVIQSRTLEEALKLAKSSHNRIDYLNIDCEGFDYEVLLNVDLKAHPIAIITIEALNLSAQNRICTHLKHFGYQLREKIHWTLLFTKDDVATHLPSLGV